MKGGTKRCAECGRATEPLPSGETAAEGTCATCGAPVDGGALSEFADRLARFGLGATRQPLMSRVPELPDAK
jgi:endogenous inhibitor of DNA gyrase (YacG/DUF329 family)